MGRPRKPYKFWRRDTGIYYWAVPHSPRWKSTGLESASAATKYVLRELQHPPLEADEQKLRQCLEPFFIEDSPYATRLKAENKQIGEGHIREYRRTLEPHIFGDPISSVPVGNLRRADLLGFHQRVLDARGPGVANKAMGVSKIALKEGYYQELVGRDPNSSYLSTSFSRTRTAARSAAHSGAKDSSPLPRSDYIGFPTISKGAPGGPL